MQARRTRDSAHRFLGVGKWELGGGGRGIGRGAREKAEREEGGGGGKSGGGRGNGPRSPGGTPRALAAAPRGVLAAELSTAPRAERKWRIWPRAAGRAPPARPSPAVADRVSADVTGGAAPRQRGSRGRDPEREAVEGEGRPWPPAPLQPRPTRSPVSSQVPPPTPGRRGGGCSPLCNRRVKKCEKRALCYLFGSRKFMPS